MSASPQIALAPMEGLVDPLMRKTLTAVGGIDWCVTEFIRVTSTLLPVRMFLRLAPELAHGAKTASGVPVRVQLLGSDAQCLADNAARAVELGAPVIDLNFGCPAPTVNRHRGGAVLLKEPEVLAEIVATVRRALPESVPLTAKMRLGYEDTQLTLACAQALAESGASSLVVHARTKVEGYRPPAHWSWIARIQEAISVPVMANGEIWSVEDYFRCREESQCADMMLGRGLVARPTLAAEIRAALAGECLQDSPAAARARWIAFYQEALTVTPETFAPARLKQWLGLMAKRDAVAADLFARIRGLKDPMAILAILLAF